MPKTIKDRELVNPENGSVETAPEPAPAPWVPPSILKLEYMGDPNHLRYGRCSPKTGDVFEAVEPEAKAMLERYPHLVKLAAADAKVTAVPEQPHTPESEIED